MGERTFYRVPQGHVCLSHTAVGECNRPKAPVWHCEHVSGCVGASVSVCLCVCACTGKVSVWKTGDSLTHREFSDLKSFYSAIFISSCLLALFSPCLFPTHRTWGLWMLAVHLLLWGLNMSTPQKFSVMGGLWGPLHSCRHDAYHVIWRWAWAHHAATPT